MSDVRRRGRPRSEETSARVLEAAADLLDERGWPGFTIDEVVRRSGVGKASVYGRWPGRFPLAVEAYGTRVTAAVPVRSTGDVVADLVDQVVRLNRFYRGPQGRVTAQLLGASVSEADGAALMRDRFFATRRGATLRLLQDASASGALRTDVDLDLLIDVLFGAVVFRLFNGQPPMDDDSIESGARLVLGAFTAR